MLIPFNIFNNSSPKNITKKYTCLSKSNSLNKLNPAELRTLVEDSNDSVRLDGECVKAKKHFVSVYRRFIRKISVTSF